MSLYALLKKGYTAQLRHQGIPPENAVQMAEAIARLQTYGIPLNPVQAALAKAFHKQLKACGLDKGAIA